MVLERRNSLLHCASVPFCSSPAWWLWRGVHTRSHLELGRKSPQRQWYYVLRRGRVGRCQACEEQRIPSFTFPYKTRRSRNGRRVLCWCGLAVKLAGMTILANAERAVLDLRKLADYCLSPEHPRGPIRRGYSGRLLASSGPRRTGCGICCWPAPWRLTPSLWTPTAMAAGGGLTCPNAWLDSVACPHETNDASGCNHFAEPAGVLIWQAHFQEVYSAAVSSDFPALLA